MSNFISKNIGSIIANRAASGAVAATAGGTGDNTKKVGIVIDRLAIGAGSPPLSAKYSVLFDSVLAAAQTLSVLFLIEDSADGTNFASYAAPATPVVAATGPAGGGARQGSVSLDVNLSSARQFIRGSFTPDMSAAGVDTTTAMMVVSFGGFDRWAAPA